MEAIVHFRNKKNQIVGTAVAESKELGGYNLAFVGVTVRNNKDTGTKKDGVTMARQRVGDITVRINSNYADNAGINKALRAAIGDAFRQACNQDTASSKAIQVLKRKKVAHFGHINPI